MWYNSENNFSTPIGALVGNPRDRILTKTASLELHSLGISRDLLDFTSNADRELYKDSVSDAISDLKYSSEVESRIYPAKN